MKKNYIQPIILCLEIDDEEPLLVSLEKTQNYVGSSAIYRETSDGARTGAGDGGATIDGYVGAKSLDFESDMSGGDIW